MPINLAKEITLITASSVVLQLTLECSDSVTYKFICFESVHNQDHQRPSTPWLTRLTCLEVLASRHSGGGSLRCREETWTWAAWWSPGGWKSGSSRSFYPAQSKNEANPIRRHVNSCIDVWSSAGNMINSSQEKLMKVPGHTHGRFYGC